MTDWYSACNLAADNLRESIPEPYRARTFSGLLGDIKALSPRKALSLISRKKGLGKQYAYLYLTKGVDSGRGYQACAAEALSSVLRRTGNAVTGKRILDVGCAVGVTAGVLSLNGVTGFDLFNDLLAAAKLVDTFTGAHNRYVTADMTGVWPFTRCFDTVFCGLTCHHLKRQRDVVGFFSEANRVLETDGTLLITLPSGSVSTPLQLSSLIEAVGRFGFAVDPIRTGLVASTDSSHSLFWMFAIIARKVSDTTGDTFIDPDFGFQKFRTPVTREEKGVKVKESLGKERMVKHEAFTLVSVDELLYLCPGRVLVFENVAELTGHPV